MQAIVETLFDTIYLITVITLGIIMIRKSNGRKQYRLFGIMAVVLGLGDSFHLVPRALALCTTGLENYTAALGIGKLITSITMTIFYILLYYVWRSRYHISGKNGITISVYFFVSSPYHLVPFPTKWLATSKSSFILGNLSQYSICSVWSANYRALLSGSKKAA